MNKFKSAVAVIMAYILSVVCVSCRDDVQTSEDIWDESTSTHFSKRSFEEAFRLAEKALCMLDESKTRSGQSRTINLSETKYVLSNKTRNSGSSSDTLLYVFNYAEDAGYAIISANNETTGLLAVTETGHYDGTTSKENGGLALFMEMAKKYTETYRFIGEPLDDTLSVSHSARSPLVEVTWGQNFPEGLYCPNTTAGCINTAIAQIASYFEYPTQLTLTFAQADQASITLDWDEMKQHIYGGADCWDDFLCSASVEAHKNIGRFCRQCAKYSNSLFKLMSPGETAYHIMPEDTALTFNYYSYEADGLGTSSTSSSTNDARSALNTLGYTLTSTTPYSSSDIRYNLLAGWPVLMTGKGYNIDGELIGHAWVIDGFQDTEYRVYTHRTEPASIIITHRHYNHINWGANGKSNGYFLSDVFDTDNAYLYDNIRRAHNQNYTFELKQFAVHL